MSQLHLIGQCSKIGNQIQKLEFQKAHFRNAKEFDSLHECGSIGREPLLRIAEQA